MPAIKLSNNLYSVGVLNPNLRVFDIVMKTDFGTSYNSFLLKGDKNVLIETCHLTFFPEYIENIKSVCDLSEISYIILNHTEPDHSGSLAKLAELCPNAEILCSKAAAIYLKGITNRADLKVRTVGDGDTLDIGTTVLKFISAPFLHWPDSIFTWDEQSGTLYSCDFFGSHFCEPAILDKNMVYNREYEMAFKGYYDAIFGPFPTHVKNGLSKIAGLDVKMICCSHGPVLTDRIPFVKKMYDAWSEPHVNTVKTIPIFYCSAYGNTRIIASAMRDAMLEVIPSADIRIYDIIHHDMTELGAALNMSDAFLIGSPTINRDAVPPVWQLLSHIDAINIAKRPCAVFGSYGWSGEAVPAICQRLSTLKLNVFENGFKFNFVPNETELADAQKFAKAFAESL